MIPVDKAHNEFIEHLKEKNRAHSTILAYGKDVEQLLDYISTEVGKSHVHNIETDDLKSFMEKLNAEGFTKKSISRKLNSTKTFFRFLKINEYITDDPAATISHPKFETKPPRILTKTEYRALRDAARNDVRTYAIIELLIQTGIRIGELADITMDQLTFAEDEKSGKLFIPESRTTVKRTIPLNEAVTKAVKDYIAERPETDNDTLFVTRTGSQLLVRNIRSAIDRYYKKAGIEDAKVNDLRHTFIAHHLKKGASVLLISKMAGHRRIATTEKYLEHIDRESDDEDPKLETL
ncbi:tyrosine-type recombinase/integrase [candidate division WWE3 bacterium]|uniref:Tyrosine-type recombinase/integrase n=1 Tax=candidate division WWE3 bacterium TaxID=2053526 RepID=A0A955RWR9_UNCKA|nr:tyrosine-type recombinase/integrase [candidate division WWE3 bacterium]